MLATGMDVFLQLPSESNKRILHAGKTTALEEGIWIAAFDEPDLEVDVDQDVLVYYEIQQKFSKQPARIHAMNSDEQPPIISFQTTGEPVQAEDRECYRVSATMSEMTVTLDEETDCPLADISATGFGVLSEQTYEIGQSVSVTIAFDGQLYAGTAIVQGIKEIPPPWTRYGLSWAGDKNDGGNLEEGAHKIGMAIQREQLRRRAGAAA